VGIVGFGAIGKRVAKRLKGFEMYPIVFDPLISEKEAKSEEVELVGLNDLMSRSDFVSLHAPNTEKTKGLIGRQQISLMKPTAFFINTARAELVDEPALIQALKGKKIAGAAIDVYLEEPLPSDNIWYSLDNVICTPHIGGASNDVILHQSEMAIMSVVDYLEGREPLYISNKNIKVSK
jgi:phosphoglycerate dehydrogenase-like enzyme